jgi:hypothetical protein
MKISKLNDMDGGWFVGNFEPCAFKTEACEVSWKRHTKGEIWPVHYHAVATEINLLVRGRMHIQHVWFEPGDIFVIEPGEIADPVFVEDCELVVVKVPSVPGDKFIVAGATDADFS